VRPLYWAGSETSTQWNGFLDGVVAGQLADEKIRKVVRVTIANSATRAARGSGPVSEAPALTGLMGVSPLLLEP
jgi:hypothetical protein